MLIFSATQEHFLKDSMSLAGCQINLIDVNFHFEKSLEIFDKIQLTKSLLKKDKGW